MLKRLISFLVVISAMAVAASGSTAQQYDLLLKGGRVIDPKNGRDGVMDVAITGAKIARVEADIPAASARTTIGVSGLYVTPGLVDLHTHVYAGTGAMDSFAGDSSIYPDSFAPRGGVTTVVDVGSSGWKNFPDFKWRVIDRSLTRVLAMLNVVGSGMGPGETEQTTADMDPEATARVAKQFPDIVVGVKSAHYMRNDWTSVDRAVAAGRLAGIPVMVDFGASTPERSFEDLVLTHLGPGDIVTHMYVRRYPTLGLDGRPLPHIIDARKRGVKFDVGHGNTSFSWDKAMAGVKNGFWPDTISSDAHIRSTRLSMKDLPTVMSKMLAAGLPLNAIIDMTTVAPARMITRPALGHLDVGGEADVAVFGMRTGTFGFADGTNVRVQATQKLECELTIRGGQVIWDLNGLTSTAWK